MSNVMNKLYFSMIAAKLAVSGFIAEEVRKIRQDERGMEFVQVLLLILFVVVIAAVLWAFLSGWVEALLGAITDGSPTPIEGDIEFTIPNEST
ncbi:MAG: hypothetical protein FWG68_08800 [Defluviitaleaceae bacterium]|nr:hypothetical protein [Defluviitaleaceae bacterium]